MTSNKNKIELQIKAVQKKILTILDDTHLKELTKSNNNILDGGKMLRSKLVQYLGLSSGTNNEILVSAGAAVDIMHSASLIHDDVIDGGLLRRNEKSFWKKYGTNGAILFGDILMFRAIALLTDNPRIDLLKELINMTGEVCRSEAEQELILRGTSNKWNECENIARFKTGSLFAFAAVAGGSGNKKEANALRNAGFDLGTAYQLADDILDASGNEYLSGKTLGKDLVRGKTTAKTAYEGAPANPTKYLLNKLNNSGHYLLEWPHLYRSWNDYILEEFNPIINQFINS